MDPPARSFRVPGVAMRDVERVESGGRCRVCPVLNGGESCTSPNNSFAPVLSKITVKVRMSGEQGLRSFNHVAFTHSNHFDRISGEQ